MVKSYDHLNSLIFSSFWAGSLRDTVSGPDETHIQVLHQPDLSANSFLHRFERCFIIYKCMTIFHLIPTKMKVDFILPP